MKRLAVLFGVFGSAIALAAFVGVALALFTDTVAVPANTFSTDTLDAPTGLTATGGASVSLSWTATADTYASGHRVLRGTAAGGPYTQIAEVTPRTTTTFTDSTGTSGTTYFYVVRAFFQSWESANSSESSATVSGGGQNSGLRHATLPSAGTTNSGDNNGFETNADNALVDSLTFAQDIDSGTGTETTCSAITKDRHSFLTFGFGIPAGSTINGIEVRVDAWADSTVGSPFMCVELISLGPAGTKVTVPKTTPTLGTSEQTFMFGSATDTWGVTWDASDFLDSSFFLVRITNVASDILRDFSLDWVAAKVHYTPPTHFSITSVQTCTANAPVATAAGDNNGFEVNAANGCVDDAAFAQDIDSGNGVGVGCTGANSDRHLFYNFNLSVPAGKRIRGIEVVLDSKVDSETGAPDMCAALSWDGGTIWTADKTTPGTLSPLENRFFLGSPLDTWGRTWSPGDFANANFRVRVSSVTSDNLRDFELDSLTVQVGYTDGTGLLSCTANAAVTTSSGDNNGFQTTPGNACADDATFAVDTDSGTSTVDSCTDAGKDRHLFYNYGITSIPAGSTVKGIEVSIDNLVDSQAGNPKPYMCVELSWDGGTTWAAPKKTGDMKTSETTFILGSLSDTWGRTWAVGDFSDANFRVRITNVGASNLRDFSLDWVTVQVTYTPP